MLKRRDFLIGSATSALLAGGIAKRAQAGQINGVYDINGFGNELNELPWLRASQQLPSHCVLLVDPTKTWTFSQPVTFSQNGLAISNPYGRRDYSCIVQAGPYFPSDYLIKFNSGGGNLNGINFWGKASELSDAYLLYHYPSASGVSCNRSDPNLDITISDCGFYGLRSNIYFKGRSITIERNSFDEGQYHVFGEPYPGSQMRNIRIRHNVHHNLGKANNWLYRSEDIAVIKLAINDAWVEGGHQCQDVDVYGNSTLLCNTFYNGPLTNSNICGNRCNTAFGRLISINGNGQILSENRPSQIINNQWHGNYDPGVQACPDHAIYINGIHNVTLQGNNLFQSVDAMVKLSNVYNAHVSGETYAYSCRQGGSAALIIGALAAGPYRGIAIDNCKIQGGPDGTANYDYAVKADYGGAHITISGGQYRSGRISTILGIPANNCSYFEVNNYGVIKR